jgi:arylsulfatase A-like enzyme
MPAQPRRRNLVVVLFDDLGWRDFGSYGHPRHQTPNIDALASEGVRFTQAYAACPVCSPSRAGLLTGRNPVRSGVTDWIPGRAQWPAAKLITPRTRTYLPLEEVTLGEILHQHGYRTASIGKWHLGGAPDHVPGKQGFHVNVGGDHRGANSYYGPFAMPGLEGKDASHYLTRELGKAERDFVAGTREPFFLYSAHYAVHLPLQAPGVTDPEATYGEMLRIADEQIGLLREQLRKDGRYEDTAWVLTSDNGGLLYEGKQTRAITDNSPLRAGKGHLYEGGIRVPLIISAPGLIPPGGTSAQRVTSLDILPTAVDLLEVPRPAHALDGDSLLPVLRNSRRRLKARPLYWHYPHYSNQGGVPGTAMIESDWKLIEFHEDNRLELYHLRTDPGEKTNLARRNRVQAMKMWRKMQRWRETHGAILPQPNPAYDREKADQGLTGVEAPTEPVSR